MQPEPAHVLWRQIVLAQVLTDHRGDHGHDFLEHLTALLLEQQVPAGARVGLGAVEEAEVVADVVGELGAQLGAEDRPDRAFAAVLAALQRQIFTLDDRGCADVAEDEVAITVFPVQMRRANLRVDHQNSPRLPRPHGSGGHVDAESRRRAGHVHIEGPARVQPQRRLYLDRYGRIGALHVRGCANHPVDVADLQPRFRQRVERRLDRHFRLDGDFIITAGRQAGRHPADVEHAVLVEHVAGFDPAGLDDEFVRRRRQRFDLTRFDRSGILGVEGLDEGVERLDQLVVGNTVSGGEKPGSGDGCRVHDLRLSSIDGRLYAADSPPCLASDGRNHAGTSVRRGCY